MEGWRIRTLSMRNFSMRTLSIRASFKEPRAFWSHYTGNPRYDAFLKDVKSHGGIQSFHFL